MLLLLLDAVLKEMFLGLSSIYIIIIVVLVGRCDTYKIHFGIKQFSAHDKNLCPTVRKTHLLTLVDSEVADIINLEYTRQIEGIELIASENFVSPAVQQALGSCLMNKYSEGLPGARYYGGNCHIDRMEELCQKRALELFSLTSTSWGVNVQPYSGSPANFAVYTALLQPKDRLMGLDLPSGGHLTHGYHTIKKKVSATSIFFESMPYRVDPANGMVDYAELEKLAHLFKPKLLIAGASAYSRDWDYHRMRKVADSINAYLMADISHIAGFVACGLANNPFAFCDVVTTTTHKSLRGPRAAIIFGKKELMDRIDQAVFPALQGGPHNHQIAAIAVALKEAMSYDYREYISQVLKNSRCLASELTNMGHLIVSGGTDNHLFLWDLQRKELNGFSGSIFEALCDRCNISVNKNSLPTDVSAVNPGGIRIGTPATTTRGMKEVEMRQIANFLNEIFILGDSLCTDFVRSMQSKPKVKELTNFIASNDKYAEAINRINHQVLSFAKTFPHPSVPFPHISGMEE